MELAQPLDVGDEVGGRVGAEIGVGLAGQRAGCARSRAGRTGRPGRRRGRRTAAGPASRPSRGRRGGRRAVSRRGCRSTPSTRCARRRRRAGRCRTAPSRGTSQRPFRAAHACAIATRSSSEGCVPVMSWIQPGGFGSPSDGLRERVHHALERVGVARDAECLPVGLGLHPARDQVRRRRGRELEHGRDEQRERHRLGGAHPAAALGRLHQDPGAGNREDREPADALGEMVLRVVRELVREDDLLLPLVERLLEERVPEDDAARRAHAVCVGVRELGVLADLLDPRRDVGQAELALEAVGGLEHRVVAQGLGRGVEVGRREREERGDGDEDRRPRQPPPVSELSREPDHDQQGEADRDELRAEEHPVLDQPGEVVGVGEVVAPRPPVRDDPEGEVHEPHDREAEHPEEHPGPDRPRRRLPRVRSTPPRVEHQRAEHRDLGEDPEDVVEALEPLRLGDDVRAEDGLRVHGGEGEVVRDVRGPEKDGPDGERRDDENPDGALQNASPAAGWGGGAGGGGGGSNHAGRSGSSGTARLPSSTGAPYG